MDYPIENKITVITGMNVENNQNSVASKREIVNYLAKKTYNPLVYHALVFSRLLYTDYFSNPLLNSAKSNVYIKPTPLDNVNVCTKLHAI